MLRGAAAARARPAAAGGEGRAGAGAAAREAEGRAGAEVCVERTGQEGGRSQCPSPRGAAASGGSAEGRKPPIPVTPAAAMTAAAGPPAAQLRMRGLSRPRPREAVAAPRRRLAAAW